ncbi:MAG: NlpC/P60 family protein [Lachnospiraceae bacterium]|nr:NlpC/P60 family protein [Lachnospiraceae bacterium]MDY5741983.1 NlpC/P60 family protein [Lachnospiraceae bacterium]
MKKLLTFLGVCAGALIIGFGSKADVNTQAAPAIRVVNGQRVDEKGQAVNGSWVLQQGTGWWYRYDDNLYPTSRWLKIDGNWFYFKANGYMARNTWIKDYYLGNNGAMLTNTYTPDGYRVDASGKWMKGNWRKHPNGWWFEYTDGRYPFARWAFIEGRWFYFDAGGYMLSNTWVGNHYLGADGVMMTDCITPDGYRVGADGTWDGKGKDTKAVAAGRGKVIADAALAQLGYRQRCNDLASNALRAVGIHWNGAAESFFNIGAVVSAAEVVPGDLAFYYDAGGNSTHIAVYIGDGQAVHGGWNGGGTEVYSVYIGTGPIFIRPTN